MSKIGKYSLIGLGLIVATIALLMIMATVFIDPSAYRQQLVQIVKTQTGRDLEIGGDVSLSLFPWLGVQFGEMKLNGPAGFEPSNFVTLRNADIRVAVMPLLLGRVDIDHIKIDGLSLKLIRNKQGQANWALPETHQPATQTQKPAAPKKESGSIFESIRLGSLSLHDSNIDWHDMQSGSKITASHLGLTLDRLASGEQTDFSVVTDLTMTPGKTIPVALNSKIMIDWQQQIAQLLSSKFEFGGIILESQLSARFLDTLKVEGSARLGTKAPLSSIKMLGINYTPQNKNVMKRFQANVKFVYPAVKSANTLDLKNISLYLDKSELSGDMSIGLGDTSQYKFDLLLKNINTDHYLPATAGAGKTAAAEPSKAASKKKIDDSISLPVSFLRALEADGQLRLENIRVSGIGFNLVKTSLLARNGVLNLKPFQAELYEGNTRGTFQLDVRKRNPRYSATQNLKNVQIGDLIRDMDIFDKFSGKGDFKLNLSTTGSKVSALKKNLKGSFSTSLKKGTLVGTDFIRQLREAREQFERLQGKQKALSKQTGNETVYDKLTASAIITKGVINNQDLHLVSPKLQMTGKGQIDLPRNWISYRLKAYYQEKQGSEPIKAPIKVKGPLDKPTIKVEYQKILRKEGEKRIRKEAEKALEKELRKGLENLFR